jgi:hypothetical protein
MSMVSDYHRKRTRSRATGIQQTSVYAGTICRRILRREDRRTLRMAVVLYCPRKSLGAARLCLNPIPPRAKRGQSDAEQNEPVAASLSLAEFGQLLRRTPTVLCPMGAFMCSSFVAVVPLTWMPKVLYDDFHMGLAVAGLTATIFVQLASVVGSVTGGWLVDLLRTRTARGRIVVQAAGVLCGAPFEPGADSRIQCRL